MIRYQETFSEDTAENIFKYVKFSSYYVREAGGNFVSSVNVMSLLIITTNKIMLQ
jgi:hypothetical protein